MYDPELYYSSNQIQRRDARETLLSCPLVRNWHTGSLLDVGCGSGDVTMEIITKVLPENFERLVGADLSEEMVQFARKHCSHPCISFEQLDIGLELEKQKLRDIEPFDHITSFNCLHWVTRAQPTTVENMYKLLKPGGDMLLLFVVTHPIYKVFRELSEMDAWRKYMTDVEKIFSPYYYSKDPAGEYEQLLRSTGFSVTNVTVREMPYTFQTAEALRSECQIGFFFQIIIMIFLLFTHLQSTDTFAAVNPFLIRIPEDQKEIHLDDMVNLFTERYSQHIVGAGFSVPYKSIVAYAKKAQALPSTLYDHALPSTSYGKWRPTKL